MSPTRREFIKDAAVIGAVVAAGAPDLIGGINPESIQAESTYGNGPVDETSRCPYFDQPLFCREMIKNGKFPCEK